MKYRLTITYDPVDGQWALHLWTRFLRFFWLPRYIIYTTGSYTSNSTYLRWMRELDMEVFVDGKAYTVKQDKNAAS